MMLRQVFSSDLLIAMLAIFNNELALLEVIPHQFPPANRLALSGSTAHHELLLALFLMLLELSQP